MPSEITITISGPGGCITAQGILVKRALEAAGVPVEVVDDHPEKSEEEVLSHFETVADKIPVQIKMVHLPWGG
jgi:hypothetical protein